MSYQLWKIRMLVRLQSCRVLSRQLTWHRLVLHLISPRSQGYDVLAHDQRMFHRWESKRRTLILQKVSEGHFLAFRFRWGYISSRQNHHI